MNCWDEHELRELLHGYVGVDSDDDSTYSAVRMSTIFAKCGCSSVKRGESQNVAVIVAVGDILNGTQPPGTIGGDSTAALLRRALTDESVKAVVLRVDSGGGSVFASEVIAQKVEALQRCWQARGCVDGQRRCLRWLLDFRDCGSGHRESGNSHRVHWYFRHGSDLSADTGICGCQYRWRWYDALVRRVAPDREMSEHTRQLFQLVIDDGYDDFISGVAEAASSTRTTWTQSPRDKSGRAATRSRTGWSISWVISTMPSWRRPSWQGSSRGRLRPETD